LDTTVTQWTAVDWACLAPVRLKDGEMNAPRRTLHAPDQLLRSCTARDVANRQKRSRDVAKRNAHQIGHPEEIELAHVAQVNAVLHGPAIRFS
jgi:hypothetical protein